MRAAEIEVGGQYVIREYSPSVSGCCIWNTNGQVVGYSKPFPAYWVRRVVTVVARVAPRKWAVEWTEPHPLHRIPASKMQWTTRTCRATVGGAQIVERVEREDT